MACEILLAAYNGADYGPAMLDSLLEQEHDDFTLIVRDDGSTDRTHEMLADYAPKFGGRMRLIEKGAPTGSAMGNFSLLMEESRADHVLFADIDDVWLPGKVGTTLALLQEAEARCPPDTPVYAFTDATAVDASLQPISQSYWAYKKIDPAISHVLSQSLVCPAMLGCASGINRALIKLACPVPASVTGHDWWALLVANIFGQVTYSEKQTLLYRLHGSNSSKPRRVSLAGYMRSANKFSIVRRGMRRRIEQAGAILDRFGDSLPPDARRVVEGFVALEGKGAISRRAALLRGGYLYPDLPRNLAMLVAA